MLISNRLVYIILSIVWINGNVLAQNNLRFRQLTTEDGFAAVNSLYGNSIIKDSEGFVWISTPAGLSRFDGETFKNYSHDPSNSNSIGRNLLTALHEDRNGKIWVGTISKGIYIFNKELETFSPFTPDLKKADNPLASSIWFIREDQQGNIWYGGQLGVNCWNRTTGEVEDFDGYFKTAFSFYQQESGTIWIGDTNGIHFLSAGSNQFKKPVNNEKTGTDSIFLGQGAHFTINIPIKLNPNTPMMDLNLEINKEPINEIIPSVINSKNLQEFIHTPGNRPQLLLIEDNKDVAIYIETLLKKKNRITKAINGQEGIELALSSIPDIILLIYPTLSQCLLLIGQ